MFKKIYIEITNDCNLNCSFCSKYKRNKNIISVSEFEYIIKEINNYTNYVYLHVLGEPLLHSELNDILKICKKYNKIVNITTNGTLLIDKLDIIINNKDIIRQINISVHAINNIDNYIRGIFKVTDILLEKTSIIIAYRLWNIGSSKDNRLFYEYICDKYNMDINYLENNMSIRLTDSLYLNKDYVFNWPDINNNYYSCVGKCYGTITHVGILSDGTVIPCCLDSKGVINLGNIYKNSFKDIINSNRFNNIKNGFKSNKKNEELCRHCDFNKIRLND